MTRFNVTFDHVTEASAEAGDFDKVGFIAEGVSLREAIDILRDTAGETLYGPDGHVHADNGPDPVRVRWVSMHIPFPYHDPEILSETRSLHIPETVTDASTRRILRLIEKAC